MSITKNYLRKIIRESVKKYTLPKTDVEYDACYIMNV